MPRRARNLRDEAYYHVLTRGNNRRVLFKAEKDYKRFIHIIKRYLARYPIKIYHYCLMPNHAHFLVQVNKSEALPKFMQGILQVYAHYYRLIYDSVGYVFQNRYKSLLIDKEEYLLECARYIERNPIRAGLAEDLLTYPWSSLAYYLGRVNSGVVVKENPLIERMKTLNKTGQGELLDYILQDRPYDRIVDDYFRIGQT